MITTLSLVWVPLLLLRLESVTTASEVDMAITKMLQDLTILQMSFACRLFRLLPLRLARD